VSAALGSCAELLSRISEDETWSMFNNERTLALLRTKRDNVNNAKTKSKFWKQWSLLDPKDFAIHMKQAYTPKEIDHEMRTTDDIENACEELEKQCSKLRHGYAAMSED